MKKPKSAEKINTIAGQSRVASNSSFLYARYVIILIKETGILYFFKVRFRCRLSIILSAHNKTTSGAMAWQVTRIPAGIISYQ